MNDHPEEQASFPFILKLIVAFFAADAFIKTMLLFLVPALRQGIVVLLLGIHHFGEHPEIEQLLIPNMLKNAIYFSMLVIVVFDVMLVVQLVLRSAAGRTWALIFTAGAAVWAVYLICFEPLVWLGRGAAGRIAVLIFMAIYICIFVYLFRPRMREVFVN
ncbi:MAG: hypothetical protein ACYS8W_19035 [Planctomycetota bacterium]|jgi:hypothetical protein